MTIRSGPLPTAPSTGATSETLQAAFVAVAERVRPAVVHIGTVQMARPRRPPIVPGPFADDPFFKDFFDQFFGPGRPGAPGEFRQPGLGSGVIIDGRGYVLTNFHVIKGADAVTVRLSSKREHRRSSASSRTASWRWRRSATRTRCAWASGPSPSATRSGWTRRSPSAW
jgi:S1-C subfamily serine protease